MSSSHGMEHEAMPYVCFKKKGIYPLAYTTAIVYVRFHSPSGCFFFVSQLEETNDLEVDAASIVEKFEEETRRSLLHQVCHI